MKEHHYGIIVKDIQDGIELYSKLGYSAITDVIYDELQHNYLVFLQNKLSKVVIELIQAADRNSTVYSASEGYHHICYEIESEDDIRSIFKKSRIGVLFTNMMNAVALGNGKVCFAMLKNGTIVEFVCRK